MDNLKLRLSLIASALILVAMALGVFGSHLAQMAFGDHLAEWHLALVGFVFVVTTCAFGLMTSQSVFPAGAAGAEHEGHPLWTFLDDHGTTLLWWELGALGVLTVAAIGTDEFFQRRDSSGSETSKGD